MSENTDIKDYIDSMATVPHAGSAIYIRKSADIPFRDFLDTGCNTATDEQTFITAANITDNTQKNAITNLVTDLKTAGLWTKMKAIYPMVGGTASSHKWNLKDPRDLDAAFRLNFYHGWTHSATYQATG